jgi:hypothetical protein
LDGQLHMVIGLMAEVSHVLGSDPKCGQSPSSSHPSTLFSH